jgi:hypothetical protein
MSLVLQIFWDGNSWVVKNTVFPGGCSLSAQPYSSLANIQKFITPKLFIVLRRENNRWKEERVFYNYCIGLPVIFLACQCQNWIFWLLLTVKSDLTSVPKFLFWSFLGVFKDGHLSWCFNIMMGCLSHFVGLYWGVIPLTPKLRGDNPEAALNSFESHGKPSCPFCPLERHVIVSHPLAISLCQSWPW